MKKTVFVATICLFFATFVVFYLIPAFRGDIIVSEGFKVDGLSIRFYGLTLAVGVLAGWFICSKLAQKLNLDPQKFDNLLLVAVISGLLGARLLVVVENFDYFLQNPQEIYKIWHGGLAIYGGLAGGLAGALIFARRNKLQIWKILDALAIGMPLGQAIGRFGNFFNGEAYGPPTSLPWKMYVQPMHRTAEMLMSKFYHPTFLYESLWNLLVFAFLLYLSRKSRRPGTMFFTYLGLYSFARFFLEYLRIDSLRIFSWRLNQIISLLIFLLVIVIWFRSRIKHAQTS